MNREELKKIFGFENDSEFANAGYTLPYFTRQTNFLGIQKDQEEYFIVKTKDGSFTECSLKNMKRLLTNVKILLSKR